MLISNSTIKKTVILYTESVLVSKQLHQNDYINVGASNHNVESSGIVLLLRLHYSYKV